jgi:hypothetical protein
MCWYNMATGLEIEIPRDDWTNSNLAEPTTYN